MDNYEFLSEFLHTGNYVFLPSSILEIKSLSDYILYQININQNDKIDDFTILQLMKTRTDLDLGMNFILNCIEKFKLINIYNIYKSKPIIPPDLTLIQDIKIEWNKITYLFDFKRIINHYVNHISTEVSDLIWFTPSTNKQWVNLNENAYLITEKIKGYLPIIRTVNEVPPNTLYMKSLTNLSYVFKQGSIIHIKGKKYKFNNTSIGKTRENYTLSDFISLSIIDDRFSFKYDFCTHHSTYVVIDQLSSLRFNEITKKYSEFKISDTIEQISLYRSSSVVVHNRSIESRGYITSFITKKRELFNNNIFSYYLKCNNYIYNDIYYNYISDNNIINNVKNQDLLKKLITNLYNYKIDFNNPTLKLNTISLFEYSIDTDNNLPIISNCNILNFDSKIIVNNNSSNLYKIIILNQEEYKKIDISNIDLFDIFELNY